MMAKQKDMIHQIKEDDTSMYDLMVIDANNKIILHNHNDLHFLMQDKCYKEYLKTMPQLNKYLLSQKNQNEISIINKINENNKIYSPIESHLLMLQDMLELKNLIFSKKNVFKNITFVDVDQSDEFKNKIIESCLMCLNIIPNHFKKVINDYELVFAEIQYSYIDPSKKKIYINIKKKIDIKIICHDFIHEIGHIMEYCDQSILKNNLLYIKSRIVKNEVVERKTYMTYELNTYKTNFPIEYSYAGSVYTDMHLNTKKMYTELLSFGIGMLFLNPIEFLYNDPDYFNYVLKILKQKKAPK